jgi:hypothetical protein
MNVIPRALAVAVLLVAAGGTAQAQVDTALAARYFAEADTLCRREGSRLWGVSLCGPMVFADPATGSIATNRPAPDAPRPRVLGYVNAALEWGGERWSAFVWPMMPKDSAARAGLMLHELFHRVQPGLGLFIPSAPALPDHLDTMEGRYWMQLEWRALAEALTHSGAERHAALADALAFRAARRRLAPTAAESERIVEINEGLAQYTATAGAADATQAAADALRQLERVTAVESFVRTFAYPSGAAYGLLLDGWSPGWTRRIGAGDDLGNLARTASGVEPVADADAAARRYDSAALLAAEEKREAVRAERVAELRRRFVEGPVLVVPRGRNASFITNGVTPIPGVGTIYPRYRVSGEWGSLEADLVLVSSDERTLTLPAPKPAEGKTIEGDGWKVTVADGWIVRPGARAGDHEVVQEGARRPPAPSHTKEDS